MPYSYGPYELLADGGVGAPSVYSSPTTPTFSAAKGSLCISAGGSAYMNTDGATTWTVLQAGSGAVTNVTATAPISSSGGAVPNIAISPSPTFAGTVIAAALTALGPVSPGVSGSTGTAVIYSGSGVPAFSATQGSLYLSSNGTLYGNVNGSTTWAAVSAGGTVTSVGATAPLSASGGNAPLISISNSPTFTGTVTAAGVTTLGPVSPGLSGIIGTARIYSGSGVPSFTASQGSLFLSSSGTTYINTSGSTTWTALAAGGSVTGVTGTGNIASSGGANPNITTVTNPSFTSVAASGVISSNTMAVGASASVGTSLTVGTTLSVSGSGSIVGNLLMGGDLSSYTFYNIKNYGASPAASAATNNTAIQSAITAAQTVSGANGIVIIPPGTYTTSATFIIYSGFTLWLQGTLFMANGSNNGFFTNVAATISNVWIFGNGTLDCNGANQTAVNAYGINVSGVTNLLIEGISIINAYYFPVNLYNCTNATVRDVTVNAFYSATGLRKSGLGFAGNATHPSTNCWVERCHIYNTQDEAMSFYGSCIDCGIRDSYINGAVYGIGILNDAGQPAPSNGITISGNSITGCTFPAILVETNSGGSGQHSNLLITNNRTHGNSSNSLFLTNATLVTVANNQFEENSFFTSGCTLVQRDPQRMVVAVSLSVQVAGNLAGNTAITLPFAYTSATSYAVVLTAEATGGNSPIALVQGKTAVGFNIFVYTLQASVAGVVNVNILATGN